MNNRKLNVIANEIYADWKNVNYAAKPYLEAMATMDAITDHYFFDDGSSIVRYFLCNANSWKGDKARAIKAELKAMLKKA